MNLVAHEGVDRLVVERLREDGHEVLYVAELSPSVSDEEVLQQANARNAVLLTADEELHHIRHNANRSRFGGFPVAVSRQIDDGRGAERF